MRAAKHNILLIVTIGTLVLPVSLAAQRQDQWRFRNRLHTSYEYDDNILEQKTRNDTLKQDTSVRFLFQSSATYLTPKSRFNFIYKGGLQTYLDHDQENRLIHDIEGQFSRRVGPVTAGVRLNGRLKLYLNRNLDYSAGSFTGFIKIPPLTGFQNEFAVGWGGLDYQHSDDFDNTDLRFTWVASRRLLRHLALRLTPALVLRKYDRRTAVQVVPDGPDIYENRKQEDADFSATMQLTYSKSFLITLSYQLQNNNSNNDFFSFTEHQLTLVLGLPLRAGFLLRTYAAAQIKNYAVDSFAIPIDADPERNESNFLILDLSRDLSSHLTGLLRFAYFDNESIIRDHFYRKTQLTAGFDFRF